MIIKKKLFDYLRRKNFKICNTSVQISDISIIYRFTTLTSFFSRISISYPKFTDEIISFNLLEKKKY